MNGLERRLAVLFADISGSAKLYERLGDAEALHAVDRCVKRMERAAEGFDGRLVKSLGNQIMAAFESAEAACQAALEMQQRIADLPPVSGVKLAIGIALDTGTAVETGSDITGEAVDFAARILSLARPGQILASRRAAEELPVHLREVIKVFPQSAGAQADRQIVEVLWHRTENPAPASIREVDISRPIEPVKIQATDRVAKTEVLAAAGKLCLRYGGRAYLLDERTPVLSLGRDPGSDVVIEDRKASRHHGRIELRGGRFFYVDRSTNGSYVVSAGTQEVMVRRTEIQLQGNGAICFGTSGNDSSADRATFEYL